MDTQTLMASLASAASYEVMQADLSSVTERITVDMVTRKITTDNSKFGNDHDHLAKTKVLDITRYVGDMDLATQTAVLHWENGTNGGVYALTEVDLSEDGRMLYKWPLSEEFTQNVGAITFAVHLYTIKTGVLLYHISSDPYDGKIGKTFSATSHALETTPPSQIEECIQQMKDISAEIDAKVAAAEAAATRAEEAAANFEVDDTLRVPGKAADAAATGAKLSQLSSKVSSTYETKLDAQSKSDEIQAELDSIKDAKADLSQNDSTQLDYVKGVLQQRHLPEGYPYEKTGARQVVLETQTIELTANTEYLIELTTGLVEGRTYTVSWGGQLYECVAYAVKFGTGPFIAVGNVEIVEGPGSNGEPFLIVYSADYNQALIITATDTTCEVGITTIETTIIPMAEKFLPDVGNSMLVIIEYDGTSANKTYYDILNAVVSNHHVYAIYRDSVFNLVGISDLSNAIEGISTLAVHYGKVAVFVDDANNCYVRIREDGTVLIHNRDYVTEHRVNELINEAKVTLYVQSAQQGNGDGYLYHTTDGATNSDESLRVTKDEFESIIDNSILVIKDNENGWNWTPLYTRISRSYGSLLINGNTECYTSEYGSELEQ